MDGDASYDVGLGVAIGSQMGTGDPSGSIKEVSIESHQGKHTVVGA